MYWTLTQSTQSGNGHFLAYIPSWWKICPGWWRCGVNAHFLSLYLQSRTNLLCALQLDGKYTPPISTLPPICTLWCQWKHFVQERLPFLPWVTYTTLLGNSFSIPLAGGQALIRLTLSFPIHVFKGLGWPYLFFRSIICITRSCLVPYFCSKWIQGCKYYQ